MSDVRTVRLPLEQLRWLIDQLETTFEEGQLSPVQEEAMETMRAAAKGGKRK